MSERRTYAAAVLGGLAAGGLLLWAVTRAWATVDVRTPGLPADRVAVDGGSAVPVVTAMALVVMAGSVAVVAARGRVRVAVGVVVFLAAVAAAVAVVLAGGPLERAVEQALTESPAVAGDEAAVARLAAAAEHPPWRWVALGGAVLSALVGLLVVLRGRRWPAMGSRYEAPTARSAEAADRDAQGPGGAREEQTEGDLWRAIDRGEDPTA